MRRATINRIITNAAEATSISNPVPAESALTIQRDRPAGQAKRRPSEKYIAIYHVELLRERLIEVKPRPPIHNSDDVVAILRDEFRNADQEKLGDQAA